MFYQRSLEIERRLQTVLQLIQTEKYSTPLIASELGVSIPTVSRDVTALRERGHDIRSRRQADGCWSYRFVRAVPNLRETVENDHRARRA